MALPGNSTVTGLLNMNMEGMFLCKPYRPDISRGFFHGGNPLESRFRIFMVQLIVMSLISQLIYCILRPLRQPKFVCYALGGILVSPILTGAKQFSGMPFGRFPKEEIILMKTWAYFGMIYFLFLVAVKMDISVIRRTFRKASIIGVSSMLACFVVTLVTGLYLAPLGLRKGFFQFLMSVFLSLNRFANVAYTFEEMNILSSELGQIAMSSSTISEIIAWLFTLIRLYHRQDGKTTVSGIAAVLSSVAYAAFMIFAVRPKLKSIIKRAPAGKPIKEMYVVMILTAVLVGALVADVIGSLQIGVFTMGLIIPHGPPLGSTLTEKTEFIVMEVIMPLFYVVVGSHMDLSLIDGEALGKVFLLVFVGCIAKFVGTMSAALFCKLRLPHSVLLGLMLNVKGPYDLYSCIKLKAAGDLPEKTFAVLVLTNVALTAILAPLIDVLYDRYVRVQPVTAAKKRRRALQAAQGLAELKIVCCIHEEENVVGSVALLEAMNPTHETPITAHVVHLNELVGQATPMIIPYGKNLGSVKYKQSLYIMRAFENYLNDSDGSINVMAYSVTAPFRSMHEYICSLARDEQTSLIIVPSQDTLTLHAMEAGLVRNFNINVQDYAPCTVGIYIDRLARRNLSHDTFQHSVAVIFIGGADDREALSLAIRMSSHPKVSVTVLQLVINDLYLSGAHLEERKLDSQLIEGFKMKNKSNERAAYHESVVEDPEQSLSEIRSLKGKHDLLIVGRQRVGMASTFDDQMLYWSENPELGVIGDYIASADFCNGQTSVLVLQHYSSTAEGSETDRSHGFEGDYLLKRSMC